MYDMPEKGKQEVYSGCVGGWGGVALWTFCSSDRPLRKHSVPSGAGTGRLHLERYQIFKNKGMCFPFAADLSTEIFFFSAPVLQMFSPGMLGGCF